MRNWRNKVSPGQREFFPKRKPSEEHKAIGLRYIKQIREKHFPGAKEETSDS